MEDIKTFRAGELVAFSDGEYSYYCINGLFKVLVEFDAQELLIKFVEEVKLESNRYMSYLGMSYLGWLNKNGYIEDVNYRELHTGSYGELELKEYS